MPEERGLRAALEALRDATCDLTSLEVQTYMGNLDVLVEDQGEVTDFEKLLNRGKTSGQVKLVAVTRINFDGDTSVLVPEHALPEHVQQAHEMATQAAMETRAGLIALFASVIGLRADS